MQEGEISQDWKKLNESTIRIGGIVDNIKI